MITYAIIGFLLCVCFSMFYWNVFHSILSTSMRYDLFALRDQVRRIAIERELVNTFAFQKMERMINDTIVLSPHVSLMSFAIFLAKKPPTDDSDRKQFQELAPHEFHVLRDKTAKILLVSMMLNSPWTFLLAALATPVLWALGKISRFFLYRGAETYVENMHAAAC